VPDDPQSTYASWRKALRLPNVKGLVAGRSLLYPAGGDVAAAVDTAVSLLLSGGSAPGAGRRNRWRPASAAPDRAPSGP
jgi:hypothetical protein